MNQIFGKNVSIQVSILGDDETSSAYSISGARVYSSTPTSSQIADVGDTLTQSALTEATSWTVKDNHIYQIDFNAALTDASPYSSDDDEVYYLVVNFRFHSGGAVKHIVKPFLVYRPNALLNRISVTAEDVYQIEGSLKVVKDVLFIESKIERASNDILRKIKSKNLDRSKIMEKDLNDAVAYRACSLAFFDLAGEGNRFYFDKAKFWKDESDFIFSELKPGYDANEDGVIDEAEKISIGGSVYIEA